MMPASEGAAAADAPEMSVVVTIVDGGEKKTAKIQLER